MCGILAIWRPGGVSRGEIERALDLMASRGPDARGISISADGRLGLGHLRLSILDLSAAANQPMSSADGRRVMVYNGEVVNFRAVRAMLGSAGQWRTDGDSEVLMEAFGREGPQALHAMVGMFAFALHDLDAGVLHLARDRFGIKPLYHTRLPDGGIAFASEIPPLLTLRGDRPRADEDTILTYLDLGLYDATERTFFRDVSALPPGTAARVDLRSGELRIERWYDFPAAVEQLQRGAPGGRDLLAEGRFLVEQAISDHLVADVPVGLNVSGGVDSSVLCAVAGRSIGDLHVFTQDYEPPYSERSWVEKVVGDARLHVVGLTADTIREDLAATVRRQAEPFGGVSVIGYDALYRVAAERGITVLLDGNGVDEAFLGYGKFRSLVEGRLDPGMAVSIDGTPSTLPEAVASRLRRDAEVLRIPDERRAFDHPVRAAALRDLLHAKIPRGLRFNDRMSMGRSRELRVPFLDHRLVEFAFTVPVDRLLTPRATKALFREIAAGLIGEEVAFAPKREVQSPQREWLAGAWNSLVTDVLSSESFAARGWVDPARARAAFERYQLGERANSFPIWQWLNLELWVREFLD